MLYKALVIVFVFLITRLFLFYWPLAIGFIGLACLMWISLVNQKKFLLLVGIILVMQPLLGFIRIPFNNSLDELLLLMAVFSVIIRHLLDQKPLKRTSIDVPFLMLIAIGSISSIIYHIVPTSVALGGLLLFCKGFLFFYVFANTHLEDKDIDRMLKTFLFLGIFIAIYGILGAILPKVFLFPLGILEQRSYFNLSALQSFFGHPGAFAALMGILAAFTFAQYWIGGQKKFLLLNIFFVVCMIMAFRRTSVAGYFIAVIIVIFSRKLAKQSIHINRTLVIIMLVLVVLSFSGVLYGMYNNLYKGYFLSGESPRSMLFKTGIKIAKDYFPLGTGFGTYAGGINRGFYSPLFYKYRLFTKWGLSEDMADFTNDTFWPHVFVETGFLGFILYLIIVFLFFRMIMRAVTQSDNIRLKAFALGTVMTFIISLVELTKATFYENTLWAYLYFGCLGICSCILAAKSEGSK